MERSGIFPVDGAVPVDVMDETGLPPVGCGPVRLKSRAVCRVARGSRPFRVSGGPVICAPATAF